MLLLSPLVACGVPKRGGQTKYPRKTSEFGDSTAGCHGERNISQETHAREQALHYFSEVHEGNRVPWRASEAPLGAAVLAGREARQSRGSRGDTLILKTGLQI